MNLYIDLDRALLVAGPANNGAVSQLSFKRGDAATIQATFQQLGANGYEAVRLPAGTAFKFGLKEQGKFDGAFVVYDDAWTAPAAPQTAYTFQPSFNTAPLNALLDPGPDPGADLPQVTLMGEIAWIDANGNESSTRTFTVVVSNDVIKDNEGVPSSGQPAYYNTAQTDARFVASRMAGVIPLAVGQTQYAVDITAAALEAAPRAALFNLATPTAAAGSYGARLVTSLTTAVSLGVATDAVPDTAGCTLGFLLIP